VWCSVAQCVAMCFSLVQCGAVHCVARRLCSALQCVADSAVRYNVLQILQCATMCCSVVQCGAVWCSVLQSTGGVESAYSIF